MAFMSSSDVKDHFVNVFGPELGSKYHSLHNQVIHVHMNWAMLVELTKDQERRSLLHSTGRHFFFEVHRAFVNDVLLRLSRLTDPARQGQHDNLSLWALLDDICDPCIKSRIRKLIEDVEGKIRPLKQHRDKRIAHFDLDVALDPNVTLPPFNDHSVDEALNAAGDVLERLQEEYTGTSRIQMWVPIDTEQNIEQFLHYLKVGLDQSKARRDKLLARRQGTGRSTQN